MNFTEYLKNEWVPALGCTEPASIAYAALLAAAELGAKPSIQALERATGYVQTSSGKIVWGLKSTYKRHGTINLFAALDVATGTIQSKTTVTKKRPDFQAFMDEIVATVPDGKDICGFRTKSATQYD